MGLENTLKLKADIDLAEMMGAELYVYFDFAGERMIARVPSRMNVESSRTLDVAFDLNKAHFFDAETTKRI